MTRCRIEEFGMAADGWRIEARGEDRRAIAARSGCAARSPLALRDVRPAGARAARRSGFRAARAGARFDRIERSARLRARALAGCARARRARAPWRASADAVVAFLRAIAHDASSFLSSSCPRPTWRRHARRRRHRDRGHHAGDPRGARRARRTPTRARGGDIDRCKDRGRRRMAARSPRRVGRDASALNATADFALPPSRGDSGTMNGSPASARRRRARRAARRHRLSAKARAGSQAPARRSRTAARQHGSPNQLPVQSITLRDRRRSSRHARVTTRSSADDHLRTLRDRPMSTNDRNDDRLSDEQRDRRRRAARSSITHDRSAAARSPAMTPRRIGAIVDRGTAMQRIDRSDSVDIGHRPCMTMPSARSDRDQHRIASLQFTADAAPPIARKPASPARKAERRAVRSMRRSRRITMATANSSHERPSTPRRPPCQRLEPSKRASASDAEGQRHARAACDATGERAGRALRRRQARGRRRMRRQRQQRRGRGCMLLACSIAERCRGLHHSPILPIRHPIDARRRAASGAAGRCCWRSAGSRGNAPGPDDRRSSRACC
ncbi:MAG: hypothetical protein WDW36_008301 [Sanguina aurantia]